MIKFHQITPNTTEWFEFRMNGIGASEAPTVCGINEYNTPARLYHEKVGSMQNTFFGNERTFWGQFMEEHLLKMWQYWDGKDYIANYNNGTIVRKNTIPKGVYVNEDYPWLFYTPDALIDVGETDLFGYRIDKPSPIECKCIDKLAYHNYGGLPPWYKYQIMTEMIVMDVQYAEVIYHVGGNELKVEPVEFDLEIATEILEKTYVFWYERVLKARGGEKWEVDMYEPEADGTEAFADLQKERFKLKNDKVAGPDDLYAKAMAREYLEGYKKILEQQSLKIKNEIAQYHVHNDAYIIEWQRGKSSYGKRHVVTLKDKPGKDELIKNLSDLKLWK